MERAGWAMLARWLTVARAINGPGLSALLFHSVVAR
jgi:hypothetical protein